MANSNSLDEARRISQLVLDLADLSKDIFANIASELNVPVQLARAICMLEQPLPMNELARGLGCDKSYITTLADQMESLGLLSRVPGEDRRTKLLQLTSKGEVIRGKLEKSIEQFSPVMVALDERERKSFETLLAKILKTS